MPLHSITHPPNSTGCCSLNLLHKARRRLAREAAVSFALAIATLLMALALLSLSAVSPPPQMPTRADGRSIMAPRPKPPSFAAPTAIPVPMSGCLIWPLDSHQDRGELAP